MFGKDSNKEQETALPVNKPVSKDSKTVLAEGCRINGNLFVITTTRIDGEVKGDIKGESNITVGPNGSIEGNINLPDVIVFGKVQGNIKAERLELRRGSIVNGNLKVSTVTTEYGAVFNGKCSMKGDDSDIEEASDRSEIMETSDVKVKRTVKQSAEK